MIFKLFGRTIQIRSPIKIYNKEEPVLIESVNEFEKQFGKPNVNVSETDYSKIGLGPQPTQPIWINRVKEG